MELEAVGGKAGRPLRIGQIDQPSGGVAGEKHPRLLEGFADRSEEEAQGRCLGEVRLLEEASRIGCGEPPGAGAKRRVLVGLIEAAAGEDEGPAHEGLIPAATHQKELIGPPGSIAQQDDGCRISRRIVPFHDSLLANPVFFRDAVGAEGRNRTDMTARVGGF